MEETTQVVVNVGSQRVHTVRLTNPQPDHGCVSGSYCFYSDGDQHTKDWESQRELSRSGLLMAVQHWRTKTLRETIQAWVILLLHTLQCRFLPQDIIQFCFCCWTRFKRASLPLDTAAIIIFILRRMEGEKFLNTQITPCS